MDELGLHSVLAVKTGHRGFPKQRLIEAVRGERFSQHFLKVDVQLESGVRTFYAGAFMDKIPLLLVGTCGTSIAGERVTRHRREYTEGRIVRSTYEVAQPGMHDTYRRNFNGVDLFNRDCFGSHSLQFAVSTKSWVRRMFLALFGMCETNALNAYRATIGPMARYEWLVKLADKLIYNPFLEGDSSSDSEASIEYAGDCGNMVYFEHHRKCASCGASTHWMCPCGYACCRAGAATKAPQASATKCDAYFRHLVEKLSQQGE